MGAHDAVRTDTFTVWVHRFGGKFEYRGVSNAYDRRTGGPLRAFGARGLLSSLSSL